MEHDAKQRKTKYIYKSTPPHPSPHKRTKKKGKKVLDRDI
jgi:hypothetical protein